jgi:hypothetical protein
MVAEAATIFSPGTAKNYAAPQHILQCIFVFLGILNIIRKSE